MITDYSVCTRLDMMPVCGSIPRPLGHTFLRSSKAAFVAAEQVDCEPGRNPGLGDRDPMIVRIIFNE
jgi:hypothetical protein